MFSNKILNAFLLLTAISNTHAFVPNLAPGKGKWCRELNTATVSAPASLSASDIASKYEEQMEKMREKDKSSIKIEKSDLKVVHEDEHIVVVEKPKGVLCVPGKEDNPSLSQSVYDAFGSGSLSMDKMVVHRLGMDTSGLVVFARSMDALRGMNTAFRTRKVVRKYEALLCGHVEADSGEINMPLMRDYTNPPYMRVSTDDHQRALVELEKQADLPSHIAKKILEYPKDSVTLYDVIAREETGGNPVTRVTLTSVSGRTHQLNVHAAAFGHPIAGDKVYGINGEATPYGGLDDDAIGNASKATSAVQEAVNAASDSMCIHAKHLSFTHPVTGESLNFESASPF